MENNEDELAEIAGRSFVHHSCFGLSGRRCRRLIGAYFLRSDNILTRLLRRLSLRPDSVHSDDQGKLDFHQAKAMKLHKLSPLSWRSALATVFTETMSNN